MQPDIIQYLLFGWYWIDIRTALFDSGPKVLTVARQGLFSSNWPKTFQRCENLFCVLVRDAETRFPALHGPEISVWQHFWPLFTHWCQCFRLHSESTSEISFCSLINEPSPRKYIFPQPAVKQLFPVPHCSLIVDYIRRLYSSFMVWCMLLCRGSVPADASTSTLRHLETQSSCFWCVWRHRATQTFSFPPSPSSSFAKIPRRITFSHHGLQPVFCNPSRGWDCSITWTSCLLSALSRGF